MSISSPLLMQRSAILIQLLSPDHNDALIYGRDGFRVLNMYQALCVFLMAIATR